MVVFCFVFSSCVTSALLTGIEEKAVKVLQNVLVPGLLNRERGREREKNAKYPQSCLRSVQPRRPLKHTCFHNSFLIVKLDWLLLPCGFPLHIGQVFEVESYGNDDFLQKADLFAGPRERFSLLS